MTHKSSRRDFLRGKAVAGAAVDRASESSRSKGGGEGVLLRFSRDAMACGFEVLLNAGQYPGATEAALAALDRVGRVEEQLSYFVEESYVGRINREGGREAVCVSAEVFSLFETALRLHGETDGAFDVTATPLWRAWGFAKGSERVPSEGELAEALRRVGSDAVILSAEETSVRLGREGVEVNLGSIGKGHALDVAAEELVGHGVADGLLHGGQSSVLAVGDQLGGEGGWIVGVPHPLRPGRRFAEIRLRDRALGTSSSAKQFFRHQGKRYGHILDPRTGQPAEGVFSVTVLAASAALADALATAMFVMGPSEAERYCQAHPEVGALLICLAKRAGTLEFHVFGIEADELTLLG